MSLSSGLSSLFAIDLSNIDLSEKLSENEVFLGLVDHGLFAEKIPPCFSSQGMADLIDLNLIQSIDELDNNKLKTFVDKRSHDYMRYEALRDINTPRHLGIPHPESHVVQALAIKKHWVEIQSHCDKPSQKVSRIYVRHVGGGSIFEMNYKGLERFELEEEELGWAMGAKYIVNADISSCFPSMYTHSIPWALHGRAEAKAKRKLTELPGNLLDKCTQNTRDGQTNGLLIGPHSANIISEIILTTVDGILLSKGYKKLKRHIDDYQFYASSHEESERFIRDLGMALRDYELSINEKKTKIQELPRPTVENWVRELNSWSFSDQGEIRFSSVRAFLDLALELAQSAGTSAPLNYAIQMVPTNLNSRAKRLFIQESVNLALFYPYLAPVLDKHVFSKHGASDLEMISMFCNDLCQIGLSRLYPDAIAHSIYYALKYSRRLALKPSDVDSILELDDGIATVLLLEYARKNKNTRTLRLIKNRALLLIQEERRVQDRQWLLIYEVWTEAQLRSGNHEFLADLKAKNFKFFRMN